MSLVRIALLCLHASIVSARLGWDGPIGEGSRLSLDEVGVEIDTPGLGLEAVRGTIGRIDVVTKAMTLGPWSASFERDRTAARLRIISPLGFWILCFLIAPPRWYR